MSGAASATEALRAAATTATRPVAEAVRQAQEARAEVVLSGDLVQTMGAIAGLILACEALKKSGDAAAKELRAQLAKAMSLGATTIRTEHHVVSLKEGARRTIITGNVPPEYLVPQPDKPDLDAIGDLLRKGVVVDWATLSNGGEQTVQIRVREHA